MESNCITEPRNRILEPYYIWRWYYFRGLYQASVGFQCLQRVIQEVLSLNPHIIIGRNSGDTHQT